MGTPFGHEGSEGSAGKVLKIDRPLAGGCNVPPLAGGKVVRSTKGGGVMVAALPQILQAALQRWSALKYGRGPRRRQQAVFIFIARRAILNPQPRSGCQS